jgi:hypothetical protein
LSRCTNYRLDIKGYPYKRPGYNRYGTTPVKINSNNFVNFVTRYYKAAGTKFMIAAANGKLYTVNDLTGAATQILIDNDVANLMHASSLYQTITYKDRLYIYDGTKPVRYNGTDSVYAGFYLFPAPAGVASAGGGLSAGTYKYMVTSVAGDMGEGPAGTTLTIVAALNDKIDLSTITDPAARYENSAKRIYRTVANGAVFFFLTELPLATSTYQDVTADSALLSQYVPVHNPRTDTRFAILGYDDRVYYSGMSGVSASTVEVSDIGFSDRILDNEFFTVANNDNDLITGCAKTPSGLIFFKRNSCWLSRSFNSALTNVSPKVGTVSPQSIVEVPGGIVFLATRGEVYFYDGVNLTEIGRNIKPEFLEMPAAALARVTAVYHDFRYIISYDPSGSQGYNWKQLEYDLLAGKWDGPHENGDKLTASCFVAFDSERDRNELIWGEAKASIGSYIYVRRSNQYLDYLNKISSTLRTGETFVDSSGPIIISKAHLKGHFTSDTILKMRLILDDEVSFVEASPFAGLTGAQQAIFGIAQFGIDKFGTLLHTLGTGEGTFGIEARADTPSFEVTDEGTSTYHEIEEILVLGTGLIAR